MTADVSSPLSVLFVLPNLAGGGAERVITSLLSHFDRSRICPQLLLIDAHKDVLRDQIPGDVEVIDLARPRLRSALPAIWSMIRRLRPDVVMSTLDHVNIGLGLMRPLWPRGTRLVLRATDLNNLELPILRWAMRIAFPFADGMVFQSRAMEKVFVERLRLAGPQMRTINNPVRADLIAELATLDEGIDAAASLRLVCAGRLTHAKGFDLLLEAMALASRRDFVVDILGEGADRAALEDQRDRLGLTERVRLLGFQKNPYARFAKADGFVLSSRFEGFPNVVLEALACGTPVLSTPVPGIEELLGNLSACQVAADFTPGAIASAIDAFLARPLSRLSPDIVARYAAPTIAAQYTDFFFKVHSAGRVI